MKFGKWRDEFEKNLGDLDKDERERVLAYYGEMYADMRDGGMTEEQAVQSFGEPQEAAKKILDGEGIPTRGEEDGQEQTDPPEERAQFYSRGSVDAIEVNGALGNTIIKFYDGENITVDYPTTTLIDYRVKQRGGKIIITHKNLKWRPAAFRKSLIPDMTVLIPRAITPDCTINLAAGTLALGDGSFGNLNIYVEGGAFKAGNIECSDAQVTTDAGKVEAQSVICHRLTARINAGKMTVDSACGSQSEIDVNAGAAEFKNIDCKRTRVNVSMGAAKITLAGAKEDYDADIKNALGSCNLECRNLGCDRAVTGNVSLGSLKVHFSK